MHLPKTPSTFLFLTSSTLTRRTDAKLQDQGEIKIIHLASELSSQLRGDYSIKLDILERLQNDINALEPKYEDGRDRQNMSKCTREEIKTLRSLELGAIVQVMD
uniref:Uncharacterized protein n=1 Tax=Odontella aurita TaxID=265563 RepID=A0A7S4IR29_9STRA|mmetsp:Transcript_2900/g.7636  ORF Transcript_2900/g.7636 Transcript_2900/m.7636 type:complete len:104 (+) Transcript_2900:178-489(+)